MSAEHRRRLHELLTSRVAILREIESLSRRRADAVAAGRTDAVARLVAERTPLIERLVSSAGEVETLAGSLAGSADASLLALVEEAAGLVDRIEAVDRTDEAAIAAAGTAARREFDRVAAAGRAGRAYQDRGASAPTPSGPRMERSA